MTDEARTILLIADSHVKAGTPSRAEFFELLARISRTSYDVVFLGDIMDLWIGVPGYEDDMHRQFLAWCRDEKTRRRIAFLEGNHEYFVLAHHAECFTVSGSDELRLGDLLLTHGDYQVATPAHRRFRWWCKSRLAHFLLRFMPFAAAYVRHLKRKLERKSRAAIHRFPGDEILRWAHKTLSSTKPPLAALLLGHFHRAFSETRKDGQLLAVLPAWKDRGEVALYDPKANRISFHPWRSLPERHL